MSPLNLFFEVWIWVSWVMWLVAQLSSLFRPGSDFVKIGRHKWRWCAFNLIGICPYIGVVTSLVYRNVVARHLPARPDRSHPVNVRPQNPGPSFFEALSETGEPTRQRSPDPVPFNYQPRKQERVRIPHADCHATGWRENPNGAPLACTCDHGYTWSA